MILVGLVRDTVLKENKKKIGGGLSDIISFKPPPCVPHLKHSSAKYEMPKKISHKASRPTHVHKPLGHSQEHLWMSECRPVSLHALSPST